MLLSDVITAARDRHPAFERTRVPHVTLARYLTAYQRELVSKAARKHPSYLAQTLSIVMSINAANAVGTAGAGTSGGLPAELDAAGNMIALEAPVGSLVELDLEDAQTMYGEKVVSSATINTLTYLGAGWGVNEHATRTAIIVSGRGTGQRRTITSNSAIQLVVSQNWLVIPDATSVFLIVIASAQITETMGVAASAPFTSERSGYLVKQSSTGIPYIDLAAPLVAVFDRGIPLPPHHRLVGDGTVRFADCDPCPLALVDYGERHRSIDTRSPRAADYAAYVLDGELVLLGDGDDWLDVTSIEIQYVPIPPAFTGLTDVFLLPDTAFMVCVAAAAYTAGLRVNGLPDVPKIDVASLLEEKLDAEKAWLQEVATQRRKVHVMRGHY